MDKEIEKRIHEFAGQMYDAGYAEGTRAHDGERGSIYYGGYSDGYKDGLNTFPDWAPVSEPPKEDGEYLVTLKLTGDVSFVDKCSYSHNLYSVDKFDFADEKRPGWYQYSSEWGYYEVKNVTAWMPLPEAYKEVKDE